MHSANTVHIVPAEWRWVIIISSALLLVVFAPLLWVVLDGAVTPDIVFMGALHQVGDAGTYLSRIQQGVGRGLLVHFSHTPEVHEGAIIYAVYPLIGQFTGLTSLSPVITFHVARLAAAMFMYMALYQLAAGIWMRVRTRRIFFLLAAVGSGLGWLFALLQDNVLYPDLALSQMSPFYSTLANVHYPLGLACMALLASVIVQVFRPGMEEEPGVNNQGVTVFALSLALVFIYPHPLVPIGLGLAGCVLVVWFGQRRLSLREARWGLWTLVPALPVGLYYFVTARNNPAVMEWVAQSSRAVPAPHLLLVGLGLPLLLGLPGLLRALRRLEADGDRFMLFWLASMLLCAYLVPSFQEHYLAGVFIPLAYFAARSLEDFWMQRVRRRWRYHILLAGLPLLILSNVYALIMPLAPLFFGSSSSQAALMERGYSQAFTWLGQRTRSTDVVMAAPDTSIWIPLWSERRTFYGHPTETMDAAAKRQFVLDWYGGEMACDALAGRAGAGGLPAYAVRYVVVGPRERALGPADCTDTMTEAASFGSVQIYRIP